MIDLNDSQAVKEASRHNRQRRLRGSAKPARSFFPPTIKTLWRVRRSVRPPLGRCHTERF